MAAGSTVGLEVLEDFHAFGTDFKKGTVVTFEAVAEWPDGTLARRMEHEFLKISRKSVVQAADVLAAMTKEELVDYAKEAHDLELDAMLPFNTLLEAVRTFEAEALGREGTVPAKAAAPQ